jgi:EmrB/QacA subfamily drug resistance transporter
MSLTAPHQDTAQATPQALNVVPFIAAGAMFMENLDSTVIVTALPAIAFDFGVSATSASLGISAYLLAVAVFIPLSAWLADRFGTRTVLCLAMMMFTLASVLCGLCSSLWSFIAMRVVQGASAALMTPVARLVVVRNVPKAALMHAIAIITWPALIAPVLGPPLGGFITTYASWHWIFFINLPIGIVGIMMVMRFVPQHVSAERRRFDGKGFLLTAAALAGVIGGLDLISGSSRHWLYGGALLLSGFVLGFLATHHAQRAEGALVSLLALRTPTFFAATITGGMFSRVAISAVPFLLPLLFQTVFGYTAFLSGLLLLAYFVGNIGMKLFTTQIIRLWGFKRVLICNGVALAVSAMACAFLTQASPLPLVLAVLLAGGMFRSLQLTALNSITFADIPAAQMSGANTLAGLVQQISITLGVAVGAFFLNASQMIRMGAAFELQDFKIAFLAVGALGMLAIFANSGLTALAGGAVSGHQPKSNPAA